MFSKLIAAVALLALAAPVTRGAVHNVTVGGPGILKYDPPSVNADPGDEVIFTFKQENHTVTQSSLDSPCTPLEGGFDSGFVPVGDNATEFPIAQFTVQDVSPVWVYCRQANHCQLGMVFAINPGDKLATFQANAVGNSTASSSSTAASTTDPAATVTAPATIPSVVTVTATVTVDGTTETTTYGSYPGSAAPTAVASQNHVIAVGQDGTLTFTPSNISAQVGDTLTFRFLQKNHTATQSSFASPCSPLSETSTSGQVGFDSGFMPVVANSSDYPSFTVTINDTAPIWVYCKQTNPASHCTAGMVFSANAIESGPNNFAAFKAKAMATGSPTGSSTSTSASSTPSSTNGKANSALRTVGSDAGVLFAAILGFIGVLAS
ncbi:Cupredoxin [Trametes punicea]|nr:Cupredoxin [Trametes punicea]